MAFRTWAKLLAATLGVGALAGASQLGLAYGLGIVRLTRVLDVPSRDQWTAQLAWVAWIPTLAAVVGALVGAGLLRRWAPDAPRPGVGTELALACSAAIGAAIVVPLTMQPARTAHIEGVNAVVVIAICAGLGALVGVFAAWAALAQAVARWSLITMGVAVWAVALISVAPSLAPGDPLPAVRLGVFDAGFLSPAVTQRTALATMPALALLIGAALGWAARRRELPTLTIALAGLPGAALLTIAYLIAGPGAGEDRYQIVPYWAAMTATGAGVLGSVLAAVLRRGPGPDDDEDAEDAGSDKPQLPKRQGQSESAIAAAGAAPASPAPAFTSSAGERAGRPVDTGVFDLPPRVRSTDSPTTAPGRDAGGAAATHRADPTPGGGPAHAAESGRPDPLPGYGSDRPPSASVEPGYGSDQPSSAFAGTGAGLGGPPPAAAKPEKPRRRGRRSSVADAFTGRSGEFPAAGTNDLPAGPSDDDRAASGYPAGRGDESGYPAGRTRDADFGGPGSSDHTDPGQFDAFARGRSGERPRSGGAPWSPAADTHLPGSHPEPPPYVPEPATRPLPPGVGTSTPEQPSPGGGRFGRGRRPFGRGRSAEPLTPEPTPVSAPLPSPDPVSPPLSVTPAPRPESTPQPVAETPDGKRKPKAGKDEDYVDWVSGLGK